LKILKMKINSLDEYDFCSFHLCNYRPEAGISAVHPKTILQAVARYVKILNGPKSTNMKSYSCTECTSSKWYLNFLRTGWTWIWRVINTTVFKWCELQV